MDANERNQLRMRIDEAKRLRLARQGDPILTGNGVCAGCGCEYRDRSAGCVHCANRHGRYRRGQTKPRVAA